MDILVTLPASSLVIVTTLSVTDAVIPVRLLNVTTAADANEVPDADPTAPTVSTSIPTNDPDNPAVGAVNGFAFEPEKPTV